MYVPHIAIQQPDTLPTTCIAETASLLGFGWEGKKNSSQHQFTQRFMFSNIYFSTFDATCPARFIHETFVSPEHRVATGTQSYIDTDTVQNSLRGRGGGWWAMWRRRPFYNSVERHDLRDPTTSEQPHVTVCSVYFYCASRDYSISMLGVLVPFFFCPVILFSFFCLLLDTRAVICRWWSWLSDDGCDAKTNASLSTLKTQEAN